MIIQVFNLSNETKDADLRRLFSPYGIVLSAEVSRNKFDGRSRCHAFIDMPVDKEARQAIVSLDQFEFGGKRISVSQLNPPIF